MKKWKIVTFAVLVIGIIFLFLPVNVANTTNCVSYGQYVGDIFSCPESGGIPQGAIYSYPLIVGVTKVLLFNKQNELELTGGYNLIDVLISILVIASCGLLVMRLKQSHSSGLSPKRNLR